MRAARDGTLPRLVSRADIRGDLHMHSSWSDGRDSIEQMVSACAELGYEYIAITDHSPGSSGVAQPDAWTASRARPRRSRACANDTRTSRSCTAARWTSFPTAGSISRIASSQQFDIVLASLHDDAGQAPAALERRYLAAMKHPMVAVITHPTNRLIPHRRGYDLDYDRIFTAAAETGTIVEIDGAPCAPRSRRRARASRRRRRRDRRHRQRLPPRRRARPADGARRHHGAARLGRSAARPQFAAAGRGPRPSRAQARPVTCGGLRPPFSSAPRRSACITRRSFRASISATPDRFRRRSASPTDHERGTPTRSTSRSAGSFCGWRRAEPAHALNLASATQAALACAPGRAAGRGAVGIAPRRIAAAIVFAGSYTFWSQAVIAEVYALHLVFVAATLLLLLRWQRQPSAAQAERVLRGVCARLRQSPVDDSPLPRRTWSFCSGRAARLAFDVRAPHRRARGCCSRAWARRSMRGTSWPSGRRHSRRPRSADAARALLVRRHQDRLARHDGAERAGIDAPRSPADVLVRSPPAVRALSCRPSPSSVSSGSFACDWRRGVLLLLAYLGSALFAFSYNVGDTHVFYLPAHLCVALLLRRPSRHWRVSCVAAVQASTPAILSVRRWLWPSVVTASYESTATTRRSIAAATRGRRR